MSNKLSKEFKKQMERELKQYWHNKQKIERLKEQRDKPSRAIILCEERMQYIENVMKELNPFELQVFTYIFKERCDCTYCETVYNISKSTYYNIYNKAITLLAEEWGKF